MKIKVRAEFRNSISDSVSEMMGQYNLSKPSAVYNLFRSVLGLESDYDREKEHFWVIGLNQKNMVKIIELVHLGTLTASIVHPREVLRPLIYESCASFIIAHNHPSGNTDASPEDIKITHKIKEASEIMGIQLLDHIIIAPETYRSLFEFYPEFR